MRNTYNDLLIRVTDKHKMKEKKKKTAALVEVVADMSDDSPEKTAVMLKCDKWDEEYTEQQLGSENRCRKKRVGPLEFSPEVKKWIHRRNILNWLLKYHEVRRSGRKSKLKKHKLRKVCLANELPAPSRTTPEQVQQLLQICNEELERLKPIAPSLRNKHKISRLEHHIKEGNKEAAEEMRRIMDREGKARWRRVGRTFRARQLPVA